MTSVNRKRTISRAAFVIVLAVVIAIALLYLNNIIKWANYPDFGFSFRTTTGIGVISDVSKHGYKAGMRQGDQISKVNGKPFATLKELRAARGQEVGDTNTYLIERNGQQLQITITNIPVGFKRSFSVSGLPYLTGLCYALIGAIVFLMKPHKRTSWIFFLCATIFGLLLVFLNRLGVMTPSWLHTVYIFVETFRPAVLIHLALIFPEEKSLLKRFPHSQLLPYFVSVLVFIAIRSSAPTMVDAPPIWMVISVAYMAVALFVFLGSCMQLWFRSLSAIAKLRAKMILLGFAISGAGPLLEAISNAILNTYIAPSFNYYLPFFVAAPLFIGYSIVKHDLFDIDAIIKRTYGYILTTGAIAGIYGLLVFVSDLALGRFEITKSPMFPLIFILAVVFLFNPVRNRVQKFIDRVFYRLEYDYQETVQKISETMRSLLSLDQIGKAIMDTALGTMFIDSGGVLLINPEKGVYEVLIAAGEREKQGARTDVEDALSADKIQQERKLSEVEPSLNAEKASSLRDLVFPANEPLIQKISEKKKEVSIYDIQEDPLFEDERASCEMAFDQMEATLIVPLIYEDRLTGLISLGQKKSGKFYRKEDINLLNILANQGAVAIENAMMVEDVIEKERMEEELSIARDLQTSMLPAACPEIEGFGIAATSIPAREVGGDFYDFIEMGEDGVGLVIADVTGKSVSGALVMSSSRSVFRMLSEEQLTVGEIMVRANRRTKKDIKSGMFVALLYAVVDAKSRILSLCSAGQTQPIYLSAETGEARLVETEGDTFPLGILEEADYQETRLKLASGDKVVFYTDGIVEAMNEKGEMFGFDRILDVVQGARAMDAESMMKEIVDKVNEFAGGAAQHDDLTVIVLSVRE